VRRLGDGGVVLGMRVEGNREDQRDLAEPPLAGNVLGCLEQAQIDFVPQRGGLSVPVGPADPLNLLRLVNLVGLGNREDLGGPLLRVEDHVGDPSEDPSGDPSEDPWPSEGPFGDPFGGPLPYEDPSEGP